MAGRVELWGFPTGNVEEARGLAERLLGVSFRLVESAHIGPYFFGTLDDSAELTLRPNLDPDFDEDVDDEEEALAEPDFPDAGTLLYVEWTAESAAARRKLESMAGEAQLLAVEEEDEEE